MKIMINALRIKKVFSLFLIVALTMILAYYPPTKAEAAVDLEFLEAFGSTSNSTTYPVSDVPIGDAADDRYIIVAVHASDGGTGAKTITSVSIGGVAASIIAQVQNNSSNSNIAGIAIAKVPTGTTGDISVTFSTTMTRAAIAIYRVTGISSPSPVDYQSSTASNPSATLTVPAGGFAIGAAVSGASGSATWSSLTENYDSVVESNTTYTGASAVAPSSGDYSVQATFTSNTAPTGVFASWAPFSYFNPSGETTLSGDVKFGQDLNVTGAISKGSGTFVIDHPLDPENKLLYHSFVESPDAKNLYDGVVRLDGNGEAVVELPDYYEALNGTESARFLLTPVGEPAPGLYVTEAGISDNQFVIAGGPPGAQVSWQVTGIRQDPYIKANPIVVEVEKGPDELVDKGEYLFPEYYDR